MIQYNLITFFLQDFPLLFPMPLPNNFKLELKRRGFYFVLRSECRQEICDFSNAICFISFLDFGCLTLAQAV